MKINGVVVERASLHNENEINRLGLRVGDTVRLKRAGDVIPKVVAVETAGDPSSEMQGNEVSLGSRRDRGGVYRLPESCPACGSPTERVTAGEVVVADSQDSIGVPVTVRCTGGAVCPAQAIEQIR